MIRLHHPEAREHWRGHKRDTLRTVEQVAETLTIELAETVADAIPGRPLDGIARRRVRAAVKPRVADLLAKIDQPTTAARRMDFDPKTFAGFAAAGFALWGLVPYVRAWLGKGSAPVQEETITDQGTLLLIDRLERCKTMRTQAISLGKEEAAETMEMLAVESVKVWMGADDGE